MRVADIKNVASNATDIVVCIARSKEDAINERYVKQYHTYKHDTYASAVEGYEVDYIYPRTKDTLEVWVVKEV